MAVLGKAYVDMIDEFQIFHQMHHPNANPGPNDFAFWQNLFPEDTFGNLMATFLAWLLYYRADTLQFNHVKSTQMFVAYYCFGQRFPELEAIPGESEGVKALVKSSQGLRSTLFVAKATLGGRLGDRVGANPMYPSDVRRLLRVLPHTPSGFSLGSWLLMNSELGHRPAMFMAAFPDDLHHVGNNRWRLQGLFDVKAGNNYHEYTFSQLTSEWVRNYAQCADMRRWRNNDRLFRIRNVELLNNMLCEYGERAGYPSSYFTSYSPRVGRVNTRLCNLMLVEGKDRAEATNVLKEEMGWASRSDTARIYNGSSPVVD